MKYAIFADSHANLEALCAVIEDIKKRSIERMICLGDVTGYSSNPDECIDLMKKENVLAISGNHDLMVTGEQGFEHCSNLVAREVVMWTRKCISKNGLEYLRELPRTMKLSEGVLLIHSSLAGKDQYVRSVEKARESFKVMHKEYAGVKLVFFGHTHKESVFSYDEKGNVKELSAQNMKLSEKCLYMINPGSVGESRDQDPRASYIIYDDEGFIEFLKVEYDIAVTKTKNDALKFGTMLVRPKRTIVNKGYNFIRKKLNSALNFTLKK